MDMEKVINELRFQLNSQEVKEQHYPVQLSASDAEKILSLLKEQEAKSIVYKENWMTGLPVAMCPKCGRFARQFHMAHPWEETHFCPWCGQEVKWNG